MRILKNKTVKNAFWLIGEKIINLSIGLLTLSLVARYLGPDGYGMLNYAVSFVALFAIFSTLGLDNINIKSIVRKEFSEGTILLTSLYLKGIGSLIIILLTTCSVLVMGIEDEIQGYLIIMMSCMYIFKSLEVIEYWIQANQNAKYSSTVRVIVIAISAILKCIIVYWDLGILLLGFLYIFEAVLIGIGLIYVYLRCREDYSEWKFSFEYVKAAFSECWYLIVSGIFVTCFTQLDRVLVGQLVSKTDLGLYASAIAVAFLWTFVSFALINSFKPLIMKYKRENEELYIRKTQQLYSCLMLVNVICASGVFFLSDYIIMILYGEEYQAASELLVIIIWAGCFSVLGTARVIWMICEDIQKYSIIFLAIGAVFSIILNLLLIPIYGAEGAAITKLLTEILIVFIAPLFFKRTRIFSIMFLRAMLLKNIKG